MGIITGVGALIIPTPTLPAFVDPHFGLFYPDQKVLVLGIVFMAPVVEY